MKTPPASTYYQGSQQPSTVTSTATLAHLHQRASLTATSSRLCIVLVGLPARGKSFLSRKLSQFLNWRGCEVKVFNVGSYRRAAEESAGSSGRADFFKADNDKGMHERERVAGLAVDDMIEFLETPVDKK